MSKITPKQQLEAITSQAFKDVDLSPVLSLKGDELRTFTLEQMERLRAWPRCLGALWLSDQFWTADRILTPRSADHPWIAIDCEMWDREQLSDLTDDEYRIAKWIVQLALLSHDLYSHEPFDTNQLGDNLQGRFTETELYQDSFRYDNKPLVEWIRTIDACREFFWANTAMAVVFAICKEDYAFEDNASDFERFMQDVLQDLEPALDYGCPMNTIASARQSGEYLKHPISSWAGFCSDDSRPMRLLTNLRIQLDRFKQEI